MSDQDDVVIEPDADEEGGTTAEALQKKLKKVKDELAKADAEKREYLEGWQRAKADYINAKKRSEEDRQKLVMEASEGLILSLLPVLDSFDHALEAASGDEPWLEGIKNTHAQLLKALAGKGVSLFDPVGEKFDPLLHEPVETLAVSAPEEDNIVTKVHQKGYALHGKIIRPARVAVGHYQVEYS